MSQQDLDAVVAIDAVASGRRRPRYFELMLERAVKQAALQVSLAAEVDGRVVGFVIASLYYGEYGVSEPTASLDAIAVDKANRGQHWQSFTAATAAESIGAPSHHAADRSVLG
jgi:hypothetical protein